MLALADVDDFTWTHGPGEADVVISCGDVCDELILEAAKAYGCAKMLAVKGNHDSNAPFPAPIVDVHLHVAECGGLRFGGFNGSWRYKPRGHFLYDQREVEAMLSSFPAVDVFIAHNSPRGIHDRDDDVHYGFDALVAYVDRTEPKLLMHGHQHVDRETQRGNTRIVGVFGHRVIDV